MGSAGEFVGCELLGNTAIVFDPKRELVSGGGGLSARNVDLILTYTRIGPLTPGIGPDSNVCSDHAGGGIAYQADTEGSLAGIPDLWTAILVEVFGVRQVRLRIGSGCNITNNGAGFELPRHIRMRLRNWGGIRNNGAGFNFQRRPIARTTKSKGGGIWLLQGTFPDAPRVDLTVEAVAAAIRGNVGMTRAYSSAVQIGAMIPTAHDVCIQDLIGHREWTEANYGRLVTRGRLHFAP
jgi:hypothetical protein